MQAHWSRNTPRTAENMRYDRLEEGKDPGGRSYSVAGRCRLESSITQLAREETVSTTSAAIDSANGSAPAAAPAEIRSKRITAAQIAALADRVQTAGERERVEVDQP